MKITKKYLIIPTNSFATKKSLRLFCEENGQKNMVMDLACKIDTVHPDYYAHIDMQAWMGKEILIETVPEVAFEAEQSDTMHIVENGEDLRPFVHFTPKQGWMNDPNGLIFYEGIYHMFYQYNPMEAKWDNMHWGHATGRDLLHWEEQDIALAPDSMGTMFSGSAIEDVNNLTGLKENGHNPFLLYYTAAGNYSLLSKDKAFTQCLAYSTDGGVHFCKYDGNPVVEHMTADNRDPKVVWVPELNKYLMALYLVENRYEFMVSENLTDWSHLQEIRLENDTECPDMQPFMVGDKRYWVLLGASDKYQVGSFEHGKFIPQTVCKTLSFSPTSYAAQSFSGITDGRVLRMTWDRLKMPSNSPSQMSFPQEMELHTSPVDCYLTATPAREIETLYLTNDGADGFQLEGEYTLPLCRAAYDIFIHTEYKSNMQISVFGLNIQLRTDKNQLIVNKIKMPISTMLDDIKLRMVVDSCSVELFLDDGRFLATIPFICDYNLPTLNITADETLWVNQIACHKLRSVLKDH